MRKLVEFQALGLEVVPWSVPNISVGTARDGHRYRRAGRSKKSTLALGKASLDDWKTFVANAAKTAWGDRPPYSAGPVRVHFTFLARTPKGHRHGELWSVGVKWVEDPRKEEGGYWAKVSERKRPEPDVTNMQKATEDALEGITYGNDVQARLISSVPLYGPWPGVRVTVHAIEPGDFPGQGDPV